MTNAQLAARVAELADLMALDGADPYRVGHYRRAAAAIRRFHHSLAAMIEAGADLRAVPGIGKGLAGLLADLVRRGSSARLEEYRTRIPAGLVALMRLNGVGATRARTLRDAGVDTVEKLEAALADREIRALDGFGPAVVARLRRGLAARAALAGGSLLVRADRAAERLAAPLRRSGIEVRFAGDLRRCREVVTDADIVCAASAEALWDRVGDVPGAHRAGARGDNPLAVTLNSVRLRLVAAPAELIEAVAHHLTGPPAYIEALAARARERADWSLRPGASPPHPAAPRRPPRPASPRPPPSHPTPRHPPPKTPSTARWTSRGSPPSSDGTAPPSSGPQPDDSRAW